MQRAEVVEAHEADAAHAVALDLVHGQQADGEHAGDSPGAGVEEQRLLLDGFAAPLGHGGQEPGDGEDDPPHAAGHGEEVEHHEEQGAGLGKRRSGGRERKRKR